MRQFRFLPKDKLSALPKEPGVYKLSSKKEVLYIGKASNLRRRVLSHFTRPTSRDLLFIEKVSRVGYQNTPSDIEALLLESALIKRELPRYNVMWRDDKKYFYVGLTKEKLPRVFLTHQPHSEKDTEYLGPFVDGRALKLTLRLLRSVFPYYTRTPHPALPCASCHLGLCPGPAPNAAAYKKNLKRLKSVLQGKRGTVLSRIKREMKEASKKKLFERAGTLRDQALALERIASHGRIIGVPSESFPESAFSPSEELQQLLGVGKKVSLIEAYDISNIQGVEATGSLVLFRDGKPEKSGYRKFRMRLTGKPNDVAMIEELISRRLRHPEWRLPDLMLIDGGKGQLGAALRALERLRDGSWEQYSKQGLPAVVALAKQHNELFLPGKKKPVLLKDVSPGVRNLLMRARDEAHRFAISYHRKLMGKREG